MVPAADVWCSATRGVVHATMYRVQDGHIWLIDHMQGNSCSDEHHRGTGGGAGEREVGLVLPWPELPWPRQAATPGSHGVAGNIAPAPSQVYCALLCPLTSAFPRLASNRLVSHNTPPGRSTHPAVHLARRCTAPTPHQFPCPPTPLHSPQPVHPCLQAAAPAVWAVGALPAKLPPPPVGHWMPMGMGCQHQPAAESPPRPPRTVPSAAPPAHPECSQ